jgi:peptidoglycan/LPS O-acetylase OafA/YrhL
MTTQRGPGGYYPLYDYLRIVLAVGVFTAHADRAERFPPLLGNACVQVFFALSGFLIGSILVASTRDSLRRFYFNRCTRIWIPYAIAVLVLFLATAVHQGLSDSKLWEFFFYKVTFVYNVFGPRQLAEFRARMPLQGTGNHFWSICVEEQFYLVAPFVMLFLPRWRVAILAAVVALNFAFPHNFGSIALGVLFAISKDKFGNWNLRPAGTLVLGLCLVAMYVVIRKGWVRYEVGVPFAAVSIVALLGRPGRQTAIGTLLGGMSYPFYLNHWIGLVLRKSLERRLHLPMAVGTLAALSIALVLGAVHYHFIDRVILRKRSRWYTERRGLLSCVAGVSLATLGLAIGFFLELHPLS